VSNELRDAIKNSKFFYRDHFRHICNILLVLMVLVLMLDLAIFYIYVQRPLPDFYASSSDGKLTQLTPLNTPNYSNTPLIQ